MSDVRRDYALLAYLAERVGDSSGAGKKALQKIVHLMTRMAGVESKYEFDLYTYGPFSRDLAEDMDLLSTSNVLDISYDPAQRSYHIKKGADGDVIIAQYTDFLREVEGKSGEILEFFSGKSARTLEMYSTLFFVIDRKLVGDVDDDEAVIDKFLEIKPKYSQAEAERGLVALRRLIESVDHSPSE